jgi:hypothetical protein
VHDVEAARAETQLTCGDVNDHLVADLAAADQPDIGDGGMLTVGQLDAQPLLAGPCGSGAGRAARRSSGAHDAALQAQHALGS